MITISWFVAAVGLVGFSQAVVAQETAAPNSMSTYTTPAAKSAGATNYAVELKCTKEIHSSALSSGDVKKSIHPMGDGSYLLSANRDGKKGFYRYHENGAQFYSLSGSTEVARYKEMTEHWFYLAPISTGSGKTIGQKTQVYLSEDHDSYPKGSFFDLTSKNTRDEKEDPDFKPPVMKPIEANDFKTQNSMIEVMRAALKYNLNQARISKEDKQLRAKDLALLYCGCRELTDLSKETTEIEAQYEALTTKPLPCAPLISQLSL